MTPKTNPTAGVTMSQFTKAIADENKRRENLKANGGNVVVEKGSDKGNRPQVMTTHTVNHDGYTGTIRHHKNEGYYLHDKTGSKEEAGPFSNQSSLRDYYDLKPEHVTAVRGMEWKGIKPKDIKKGGLEVGKKYTHPDRPGIIYTNHGGKIFGYDKGAGEHRSQLKEEFISKLVPHVPKQPEIEKGRSELPNGVTTPHGKEGFNPNSKAKHNFKNGDHVITDQKTGRRAQVTSAHPNREQIGVEHMDGSQGEYHHTELEHSPKYIKKGQDHDFEEGDSVIAGSHVGGKKGRITGFGSGGKFINVKHSDGTEASYHFSDLERHNKSHWLSHHDGPFKREKGVTPEELHAHMDKVFSKTNTNYAQDTFRKVLGVGGFEQARSLNSLYKQHKEGKLDKEKYMGHLQSHIDYAKTRSKANNLLKKGEKVGVEKNNWNKYEAHAYSLGHDPSNKESMDKYYKGKDHLNVLRADLNKFSSINHKDPKRYGKLFADIAHKISHHPLSKEGETGNRYFKQKS